jgi:sigma-B regulation protein RsbU (phosphoserine phosphatase)
MGKGPQAAARTSAARYTIRAAAIHEESPSSVLKLVNQALVAEPTAGPDNPFVTALFARVEPTAFRTIVRFASAGHPLPTVLRADGKVELVGQPGTLLGVFTSTEMSDATVELLPGDTLVMITDGVHDSGHPHRLQQEGLEEILRGCRGLAAPDVVDRVHIAAATAQRDDIAIVAIAPTLAATQVAEDRSTSPSS